MAENPAPQCAGLGAMLHFWFESSFCGALWWMSYFLNFWLLFWLFWWGGVA
jgi:hypothetical protein